jgi:hypothetical protein
MIRFCGRSLRVWWRDLLSNNKCLLKEICCGSISMILIPPNPNLKTKALTKLWDCFYKTFIITKIIEFLTHFTGRSIKYVGVGCVLSRVYAGAYLTSCTGSDRQTSMVQLRWVLGMPWTHEILIEQWAPLMATPMLIWTLSMYICVRIGGTTFRIYHLLVRSLFHLVMMLHPPQIPAIVGQVINCSVQIMTFPLIYYWRRKYFWSSWAYA